MTLLSILGCSAVLILLAAITARRRLLVVTVQGFSMEPTLHDGDRILMRRRSVTAIRRGEIVVLAGAGTTSRSATDQLRNCLVKRVVALPGELVPADFAPGSRVAPGSTVPDDALVVVGDNPRQSHDSRQGGWYPADQVLGVFVRKLTATRGRVR